MKRSFLTIVFAGILLISSIVVWKSYGKSNVPIIKYDYKVINYPTPQGLYELKDLETKLKAYGEQGWELIEIEQIRFSETSNHSIQIYYFKRPK